MKAKVLVLIAALCLVNPSVSYGFGLVRHFFDGIVNQLGLDRGPVQKTIPKVHAPGQCPPDCPDRGKHNNQDIHIQAGGY